MIARSSLFLSLLSAASTCLAASNPPILVDETAHEYQTLADVNGDGMLDLVVVDRSSGQVRIAETGGNASITWRSSPFDSGLRDVSGFTTGYLLDPNREAIALTSTLGNRIQVIDTPSEATLIEPQLLIQESVGPALVTALQIPGGGVADYAPDFEDLIYHAIYHDPDNENIIQGFRNRNGSLPMEEFQIAANQGVASHPEAVTLQGGMTPAYSIIRSEAEAALLELYDVEADPMELIAQLADVPLGCDYVSADFDNDGNAEFVFWIAGSSTLYEAQFDAGALTAITSFTYADEQGIDALRVLYSTGQAELLIIHSNGTQADRVSYAGAGIYTIEESFASESGQPFSGALSTGVVLHLLEGSSASDSYQSQRFNHSTNSHDFEASGTLPRLNTQNSGSSLLVFENNPLTRPDAKLLSQLNVGVWTSAFTLGGGSGAVDRESFIDSNSGLGNLETATLNHLPSSSTDGLTHQVFDDLSIRFDSAPVGEVNAQLMLLTPGGSYTEAVQIELNLNGSGAIFYREDNNNWSLYQSNSPPVIMTDTTFYGVGVDSSGKFSNLVMAEYTFPQEPSEQDSNGDGVPDFVAQQYGLDPLNDTWDSDADGFSDLHEILAGTNPDDGTSTPVRADIDYALPNQFDLEVTPAIPNPSAAGALYTLSSSSNQTQVRAHMPSGFLLDSAATESLASPPTAQLTGLQSEHTDLFLVVSTELNFEVDLGSSTVASYGRQLAGLFPVPDLDYTPFTFTDFGGAGGFTDLAAEASAWQVAALSHYNGLAHPSYTFDPLDHTDTLKLLLVEQFLGAALYQRGLIDRANISLTPFRASEAPLAIDEHDSGEGARDRAVDNATLLTLQRAPEYSGSSYHLHSLIEAIDSAVDNPASVEQSALVELARLLYTLHAVDTTPGSLRQPLDALRLFLRTGSLDGSGFDQSLFAADLTSTLVTNAVSGAAEITNLPEAQNAITVYVYYDQPAENLDCPLVWSAVNFTNGTFDPDAPDYTGDTWSFVDDSGAPLQLARAFPLTTGSVFVARGYELDPVFCGDRTLAVISQLELAYLSNESTIDANGDLIPDALEALAPDLSFDPIGDSDSDGYSDLQEMIYGSDPHRAASYPMDNASPAQIETLAAPALSITASLSNGLIEFHYPSSYVNHVAFDLYQSTDLQTFSNTNKSAEHTGNGNFEISLPIDSDQLFYRIRMRLK
jgi:hypothetical protein